MYIAQSQEDKLHWLINKSEVALRSFIADIIIKNYPTEPQFKSHLEQIKISDDIVFSKRLKSKIAEIIKNSTKVYQAINICHQNLTSKKYNNDVPYVSFLFDLIMVFFNKNFAGEKLIKKFTSVEDFLYSCSIYHQLRNNFSHPASYSTSIADANKALTFIEYLISGLDDHYYWYCDKKQIESEIKGYKLLHYFDQNFNSNINRAKASHKVLIGREDELKRLSQSLLGGDNSIRLAGSVVLYGYGGVGKTALTIEFLHKLIKEKKDGQHADIEFILFYSSKDEYLSSNYTTGELYLDEAKPEFKNFEELSTLIHKDLNLSDLTKIDETFKGGVIAIDNIENLSHEEKEKIFAFIKSTPRSVQFIITSRNEEPCEEKINIQEFQNNEKGHYFVQELINTEILDISLTQEQIGRLLDSSKGNSLIITQVLNSLHRGVVDFDNIIKNLATYSSKDAEIIANFMYKNTFDNAFKALEKNNMPVRDVVIIMSLYNEKIDLYSVSKLSKIDIPVSERMCNFLCERLILNKIGEFYELNEFAKRFIFIKLMPDRFQLSNLKDKIKQHKEKVKRILTDVDATLRGNKQLRENVNEWQPKNYIDKMIIAETFELYGKAKKCVINKDKTSYDKVLKEMQEHALVTNHPYVPVQFARILKDAYIAFYENDEEVLDRIEKYYEQAVESIEYDYRYLINTNAYYSLLMLYGIFLCERRGQFSRAVRYLEDARNGFEKKMLKPWFISSNYLSKSYQKLYEDTKNGAYKDQLIKTFNSVKAADSELRFNKNVDLSRYIRIYSKFIN